MSISYPLAMPSCGPRSQSFELERVDYLAPEAGGRMGGVTAGFPLWKMSVSLGTLSVAQSDQWRSFMALLRGAQRPFLAWEVARRLPHAYQNGMPAGFSGAAASWSQAIDSNGFAVLTLTGLPSQLVLSPGDYVDFRWGSYSRALVRVCEMVVASTGGAASFTIEPPVPSLVPGTAVAHLDNPACLMKLVPGQSQLGPVERRGAISSGTLVAVQDLIP